MAEQFARHGFVPQGLSVLERERCLVHQDMGVTTVAGREGLAWVQANLAVYPIWNCPIRVPDGARLWLGASHMVDLGLYGEPAVRPYRCVEAMRALQRGGLTPLPGGASPTSPGTNGA